jgi:hypothetical protein
MTEEEVVGGEDQTLEIGGVLLCSRFPLIVG